MVDPPAHVVLIEEVGVLLQNALALVLGIAGEFLPVQAQRRVHVQHAVGVLNQQGPPVVARLAHGDLHVVDRGLIQVAPHHQIGVGGVGAGQKAQGVKEVPMGGGHRRGGDEQQGRQRKRQRAPRGKGGTDLGGPLLRGSLRRDGLQRPAHGLMKDRGRLRNAAFHRLRVLTLFHD